VDKNILKMVYQDAFDSKDQNIFYAFICSKAFIESNKSVLVTAYIVIIAFLIFSILGLVIFFKRIALFPIKERAPKLALLQGILFLCTVLVPFFSDFLVVGWSEAVLPYEIPWSRIILKSLYVSVRL
jgi:hypothetical protein